MSTPGLQTQLPSNKAKQTYAFHDYLFKFDGAIGCGHLLEESVGPFDGELDLLTTDARLLGHCQRVRTDGVAEQ